MNQIFTLAILGVGSRGGDTYGYLASTMPDKFKVNALCDLRQQRLDRFGKAYGVAPDQCFTEEEEFFKEKRADVLMVCTQDADHVRHAVKGFELGYHVVLEKPITADREECYELLDAQQKSGKMALVCHVLRYAPAYIKCEELLDSGKIGRLVAIDHLERVGFFHQAHSYVRGNWRRSEETTPMVLAKTCHDLDLLQFYAKSKCVSLSSVGDLTFFHEGNAPEGSAKRCTECQYKDTCPYSAKRIYVDAWKAMEDHEDIWPMNIIAAAPLTEEKIQKAIEEGPYGRCVFACDNNVVDHQITQMYFENGVKATLTMTGFTAGGGRRINFFGTMGEIVLDESEDTVTLKPFGEAPVVYSIQELCRESSFGHGGGDYHLMLDLYDVLCGKGSVKTSLDKSVESHLMGIAAEESRLQNGKQIFVHER